MSQNISLSRAFTKAFLSLLLLFLGISLSSCIMSNSQIGNTMDREVRLAYLKTYVLPSNPDARLEEIDYYKFLRRFRDGERQVYLFAWDVYVDTTEWTLKINDDIFYFENEVNFIVYRAKTKSFYSVNESIDANLFTVDEFSKALNNLDVFISINKK